VSVHVVRSLADAGATRPQAAHDRVDPAPGGDCIDDVSLLRAGATASIVGHGTVAASTAGTWLRGLMFGHDDTDRGAAQVAETTLGQHRLIARRTKITDDPTALALFPEWRHHAIITNAPAARSTSMPTTGGAPTPGARSSWGRSRPGESAGLAPTHQIRASSSESRSRGSGSPR
jgi:hypothetical protein